MLKWQNIASTVVLSVAKVLTTKYIFSKYYFKIYFIFITE